MVYAGRLIDDLLDELFPHLGAIALEGAKGVGKTLTATQRARTILPLDEEEVRELLSIRPRLVRERATPVLIDEWQLVPSTWDQVRRAVDQNASGGQFLLTGSANVPSGARIHSGAGRIVSLKMRPLSIAERSVGTPAVSLGRLLAGAETDIEAETTVDLRVYVEEILASGFPGIRNLPRRARRAQLSSYLERIVFRELPENGIEVRRPAVLRDWLRAYGAATATTANYTQILDAATPSDAEKPSRITVGHYRDYLTRVFVLEPLEAWTASLTPLKRLTESPKHHLVDPGLAAQMVGVDAEGLLEGAGRRVAASSGTWLGALFESLVAQSVRSYADLAEARVFHLRTRGGDHEIDLIIESPDRSVVACEVKLGGTVRNTDVKHLNWLQSQIGERLVARVLVNTGPIAYTRADGVHVVPLTLLGP